MALTATAASGIKWTETEHDFGVIQEGGGLVTTRFGLVNDTDKPLYILKARATCGCTQPKFTDDAVQPGDTTWVTVSYNPARRPGRFDNKVFIDLNLQPSRWILHVKGVVVPTKETVVKKYPIDGGVLRLKTAMLPMGEVTRKDVKSNYFEVFNVAADSITPKVTGVPPYMHVQVSPATIAPGEQAVVSANLYGKEVPVYGFTTDSLTLIADNKPGAASIRIPYMLNLVEDFSALTDKEREEAPVVAIAPSEIDFSPIVPKEGKIKRELTIENHGKKPLNIRRIYTSAPGVTVTQGYKESVAKGKKTQVVLQLDPKVYQGMKMLDDTLFVITDDPTNPITKLRLIGEVKSE